MACEVKTLVLEGLAPKTFPKRSYGKVLGEPRSEPPRNPATSGSIDHGAMHGWHHTVASLILGQLGDRFVCVKQCRYQRGEDESLSHPQTGASTATPRRSMSRRGAQPGSRPPRPTLQRPHAEPDGGFLVLCPRGVDPVLPVAEVVSRSGTPPDSKVSISGERQAPPPPRPHGTHRSRPGSATGRMASGRPRRPGQDQVLQLGGTAPVMPGCFAPRSPAGSRSRRSEAQASGGDRQESRRSVLDGAKARHKTAATETLGPSREGEASAHEWNSARYWHARQWFGAWPRSGHGCPAISGQRLAQPG